MPKKVLLMIGTRKGAFIYTADAERRTWQPGEMLFRSWNVMHLTCDPRDRRLHAAVSHFVYGATPHYSDDLGATWTQAARVPAFERPSASGRPYGTPAEVEDEAAALASPEKVIKVWNITPGRPSEPGVLYAGIEPAALFRSGDRGETWSINQALFDHPHRPTWFPGNGGLCLHTILLDPTDARRMYVGMSTGGCYRTDDGGASWQPRNRGVRADFNPDPYPEYGQCTHKMALHPARPAVLYQQNHCGMYRSDTRGDEWLDIGEGRLPSRFGFPIAVHPHDPQMVYIVPEESDEYRMSIGGQFAVWRSRDSGQTWQRQAEGLPANAHLVVLREAMSTDSLEPAGIYIGTNTGQVFYSRDDGDTWALLADYLPAINSIEVAVLD